MGRITEIASLLLATGSMASAAAGAPPTGTGLLGALFGAFAALILARTLLPAVIAIGATFTSLFCPRAVRYLAWPRLGGR